MSLSTEESTALSAVKTHWSVIVTPGQQTNTPEERNFGDKAQQDSTATPHNSQCAACDDQVPPENTWQAPCQHTYCADCLEQLFRLSMQDETLYPPRCCHQVMPWSDAKAFIPHELASDFEGKREEFDTQDKTYCSDPTCSTFIGASHIATHTAVATCPACEKLTCVTCKSDLHAGKCPSDSSVQATLDVARREKWQRCQERGRMIELTEGCNHMICPCGHQFCYACGEQWQTCECGEEEEEDEDDILAADVLRRVTEDLSDELFIAEVRGCDMPEMGELRARLFAAGQREIIRHHLARRGLPVEETMAELHALGLRGDMADDFRPRPAPQNVDRHAFARAAPVHVAEPQLGHRDRNHEGWRFVHGAGNCEHCGQDLPVFLMECETCQMRACRRCTLSRL